MERGPRGTRLGSHRSSGDAVEARRRRCRTGKRWHSVRGLLRRGEREIGAVRGAVTLGEGARLLYGAGGAPGRGGRVVNTSVNVFNAFEDGPA
jgi:hypothetical protein